MVIFNAGHHRQGPTSTTGTGTDDLKKIEVTQYR